MKDFFRHLPKHPSAMIGIVMVALLLLCSIFATSLAPHSTTKFNAKNRFAKPSVEHLMGTDQYGRDIFSRVLVGSRISLTLGISSALIATIFGLSIGLFSGYMGGIIDEIIMRLMDAFKSFPSILLALLLLTVLGSSLLNVIFAVSIVFTPATTRLARGMTLGIKNEEFVLAAEARGDSKMHILFVEILPNILPPILIEGSIKVGFAILIGASLSFLGMGTQPPSPDWGLLVSQGREYVFQSTGLIIWPILALSLTVVAFNLLGDGLRDMLTPGAKTQ